MVEAPVFGGGGRDAARGSSRTAGETGGTSKTRDETSPLDGAKAIAARRSSGGGRSVGVGEVFRGVADGAAGRLDAACVAAYGAGATQKWALAGGEATDA